MGIIEILSGAGVTGLLGNLVTTVFSFFQQKQKSKHEIAMRNLEIKAMIEEAKANIQVTETQVAGEVQRAELQAFNTSIAQNAIDKLTEGTLSKLFERKWTAPFGVIIAMMFGFVDFLKAIIRPGVTLYMTVAVTWMYVSAYTYLQQNGMNYNEVVSKELIQIITDAVLYVFVSSVLWWFGDRRVAKVMNRANNWKK